MFSNFWKPTAPCVALFLEFKGDNKCVVIMDGHSWTVETKKVRHNVCEGLMLVKLIELTRDVDGSSNL